MSEQKSPGWFVPLRVRFRSTAERAQWEREHAEDPPQVAQVQLSTLERPAEPVEVGLAPQRAQQIKELVRLGNLLRAELGLNEVLQQVAASIKTCTGFRSLAVNLIEEDSDHLSAVAFAGISEEDERVLRQVRTPSEQVLKLMREKFRISQSYFIPHEYVNTFSEISDVMTLKVIEKVPDNFGPEDWHPEDALIVPFYSPREKEKLLGFLSLDDPEDGKIPTQASIEVVELFANQAALAIDNARIFQEREAERLALEEAISLLRSDLEQIQQGDLHVRVQSSHEKLQPVADAIN